MKFFFLLASVLGGAWLTSCSDDKDGDEPNSPGANECRIESVIWDSGYDVSEFSDFKFDNSGNVISYQYSYSDEPFGDVKYVESYSYNTSSITVKNSDNGRIMVTYTLENGIITSAVDYWDNRWEYSYDADKRLKTVRETDGSVYECSWKDGNLISYTEKDSYEEQEYAVSYSENDNKIGFMPVDMDDAYLDLGSDGRMFDAILCAEGYFGEMPKKLPSRISCNGSQEAATLTYSGFNKYGYPSRMTVERVADDGEKGKPETYTMTWSE